MSSKRSCKRSSLPFRYMENPLSCIFTPVCHEHQIWEASIALEVHPNPVFMHTAVDVCHGCGTVDNCEAKLQEELSALQVCPSPVLVLGWFMSEW